VKFTLFCIFCYFYSLSDQIAFMNWWHKVNSARMAFFYHFWIIIFYCLAYPWELQPNPLFIIVKLQFFARFMIVILQIIFITFQDQRFLIFLYIKFHLFFYFIFHRFFFIITFFRLKWKRILFMILFMGIKIYL